jgi:hypothetical protein
MLSNASVPGAVATSVPVIRGGSIWQIFKTKPNRVFRIGGRLGDRAQAVRLIRHLVDAAARRSAVRCIRDDDRVDSMFRK